LVNASAPSCVFARAAFGIFATTGSTGACVVVGGALVVVGGADALKVLAGAVALGGAVVAGGSLAHADSVTARASTTPADTAVDEQPSEDPL
jgi:hypothetical protein